VMPVHLFGQPADMGAIKDLCQRQNLKLIEDCAQSFGASIDDQQTGSFGDGRLIWARLRTCVSVKTLN